MDIEAENTNERLGERGQECREMARHMKSPDTLAMMQRIAKDYERLIEQLRATIISYAAERLPDTPKKK